MRFRRALPLAALCLTAAACGGGGGGGGGSGGDSSVWHLRSVNVIRDSSNVQFFVDDTVVANADYGSVTDYKPAHTGTRPLRLVVANPPDLSGTDQGTTVISPMRISISRAPPTTRWWPPGRWPRRTSS